MIDRRYLTHGMRLRASEVATEWLGPRTEREIREGLQREVHQERWTSLDQDLLQRARDRVVDLSEVRGEATRLRQRGLLIGRLQRLETMGLSERADAGRWCVHPDCERVLRHLGERGDIIRTLQRALGQERRELAIFDQVRACPDHRSHRLEGRGRRADGQGLLRRRRRGWACPLRSATGSHRPCTQWPVGGIVEARAARERVADRAIAAVASGNRTCIALTGTLLSCRPNRCGRIRTRSWPVMCGGSKRCAAPASCIASLAVYGRSRTTSSQKVRPMTGKRQAGILLELHSHLSIGQQTRTIGATWLDHQLIAAKTPPSTAGFGAATREALEARIDFLACEGLAERLERRRSSSGAQSSEHAARSRNLHCRRENPSSNRPVHRPVKDGTTTSGIYRQPITLASGRFAMLVDGLGFALVPWRPVVERSIGQTVRAITRGDQVTWFLGSQRGIRR